jgi:hypothetical protein
MKRPICPLMLAVVPFLVGFYGPMRLDQSKMFLKAAV